MHQLGLRLRANPSGGILDPLCAAFAMLGQVVAVRWATSAGLPASSNLPGWVCGLAVLLVDKRVQAGASSTLDHWKQASTALSMPHTGRGIKMLILGDGSL